MNTSSDAAEQIVRISLEGFEVAAKITGHGAKGIAALLCAIMKDKKKTTGKTRLKNMLKSGKELKVFSIKKDDFAKFTKEAKRYGILYSALISKKAQSKDGIIDVMVKAEDAAKINRIVDRFINSRYDDVTIRSDIEKSKNKNSNKKGKEEHINPRSAKTEKNPQSKPSSKMQETSIQGTKIKEKTSVKQKLEKAKTEVKNRNKSKEKIEATKGSSFKSKKSKEKIR